ncbi:unknown [Clostridium sp. CAG:575]|nr:unknown [Clostridium sp. CAG:575]
MFNNFNLSNNEILDIINQYMNLINKYSVVDGKIDEDLKQEILIGTLKDLRKNKKIKIF